ncbi:histidine phosphatase family protein [Candidatus Roizmanbacteria bacterium]|nr:histidine phosphatase family protein [Candidatus Roizmanbacteria bacterium]
MPKKIIIVRHGQTAENKKRILQGHLDTLLDETGKKQAEEVAETLKNEDIEAFFSSDLKRALHTAEAVISKHSGKKIHATHLLREKHFGKFQGMTFGEVGRYLPKFGEQGNFSFQGKEKEFGVETNEAVKERIREFKKILTLHKGKTVAVFSHGGTIRRMLEVFGIPPHIVSEMYMHNAAPLILIKKGEAYILES